MNYVTSITSTQEESYRYRFFARLIFTFHILTFKFTTILFSQVFYPNFSTKKEYKNSLWKRENRIQGCLLLKGQKDLESVKFDTVSSLICIYK